MLTDTGFAFYCYDGQNTYVGVNTGYSSKFWRFRSNINSTTQPLAKSLVSSPAPIMALMPQGDLRVTLEPATCSQMHVQLFDMLGRQIYSRNITPVTSKVSFTIPTHGMANNQFFVRVNDGNSNFIKKEITAH